MAWFTNDFDRFFKELAANNNKDWFDANRKRYETSVKAPMHAFVAEMIGRVARLDPQVRIEPKDAIFRINRDIRFSKDKTPYKLSTSALISPGGRKDMDTPGLYFELGPEAVRIYGGRYMPDRQQLQKIREHIMAHPGVFRKLYSAKDFVSRFGSIQGERNKVLPADLKAAAEKEPLLYNKQFYFAAELPLGTITDPELPEVMMAYYRAMRPMNAFLMGKA